ncbi:BnaCnng31470D [Brassica napus]|uniref:(rape) hypothetical protein n=1 Tax=Brassica napus TaxID=3708 RepID=A0A078J195_BRANA|nr:unnamed protein product [Brassica napus]CDY56978.1 BnaCnng31470D [Brassica napus]
MLETDKTLPSDKRLRLALIMIVDGVLIAHKQVAKPTLHYVRMVDNLDAFLKFPWGRESFLKTITCMKPPTDAADPVGALAQVLQQTTYRLTGFALALQLVAMKEIPLLATKIPAPYYNLTLLDLDEGHLPPHGSIHLEDFLTVEADTQAIWQLRVIPLAENAPSWGNETSDERVVYMESLIAENHHFHLFDWPGGDTSNPEFIFKPAVLTVHRKHTVPKKQPLKVNKTPKKRASSARKQKRISNYFKPNVSDAPHTNEWLEAKIKEHDIAIAQLQSDNRRHRRKLFRTHKKQSCKLTSVTPKLRKQKPKKPSKVNFILHTITILIAAR